MLLKNPDIALITQTITNLKPSDNETVVLFVGEKNNLNYHSLIASLNKLEINFMGGLFPSVIFEDQKYDDSVIIKKWESAEKPYVIKGLENYKIELPDFEATKKTTFENYKQTALVLVDGLTANIASFLGRLYNTLGNNVNYIGGGAGSLTLVQQPCVFTNEGLFQDAAIVCFLKRPSEMSVRHGWEPIYGPIIATRMEKNIIKELNWQRAFDVYRTIVEADSNKTFTKDNFFDIAKGYPFGMYKEGFEDIVRDPIAVRDDGALICVGEIPENTVLFILKGEEDSLVSAAEQAAKESLERVNSSPIKDTIIVDCISRVLFLQENFKKELQAINKHLNTSAESVPQGILTLGEISSNDNGVLDFFNKTIVIGSFY